MDFDWADDSDSDSASEHDGCVECVVVGNRCRRVGLLRRLHLVYTAVSEYSCVLDTVVYYSILNLVYTNLVPVY